MRVLSEPFENNFINYLPTIVFEFTFNTFIQVWRIISQKLFTSKKNVSSTTFWYLLVSWRVDKPLPFWLSLINEIFSSSVNVFRWDIVTFLSFWELKVRKVRQTEQTRHKKYGQIIIILFLIFRRFLFSFLYSSLKIIKAILCLWSYFSQIFLLISITVHFREVFYMNGTKK